MSVFAAVEKACGRCGLTVRRARRANAFGRGWHDAWLHAGGSVDCPDPGRFGAPSPPCPSCGREDCALTGTPGEWICLGGCERVFRPAGVKADPARDLEDRPDRKGHQPSTVIAADGTVARTSDPLLAGVMVQHAFADVTGAPMNERRTA